MQNHYFTDSIKEFWEKNRAATIDCLREKDSVVALGKYGTALCKTAADIIYLTKSIWQNLWEKKNGAFLLTFPEKWLFPRYCQLLLYSVYVWVK